MTTNEALAIAAQAKPTRRKPLDKLVNATTAADVSAGVTALTKRFDAMRSTVAEMQTRIDQAVADVEYLREFQPGQPRRMHS